MKKEYTFDSSCDSIELGLNTLIDFAKSRDVEITGTVVVIDNETGVVQTYNI